MTRELGILTCFLLSSHTVGMAHQQKAGDSSMNLKLLSETKRGDWELSLYRTFFVHWSVKEIQKDCNVIIEEIWGEQRVSR